MRQYNRGKNFGGATREEPLIEAFVPYYFRPPIESDWTNTTWVDPVRGWAMSTSYPPSSWDSFTNGCGFIFQARPSAAGRMNGTYTDGQVEMWAYGAHVTTGGSGNYEEHTMFQNNALFVDGIGLNNMNPAVSDPWLARITAFTNATDYTYASADLTKAFARTNWYTSGYQNIETAFYSQATNARPYISAINRSVVFPHKKYLVIYDQMQTTQPAQFQWKWNVWGPTAVVNNNNCSFTYTCTNGYNRSNVTVYVAHIVKPTLMTMTNMTTGSQLFGNDPANIGKINPFTGENYNTKAMDVYYPDYYWPYWAHAIWVSNKTPATTWHFMTVVYPVRWGGAAPTITRIDDNTVRVQQGLNDDTISFDPSVTPAAVTLNLSGPSLVQTRLAAPSNLHTTP
jgi:hypothetical protein